MSSNSIQPLTGLRFLAAFLVFLHNLNGPLDIFHVQGANLGNFGVTFFFVLSGFVLTYVYADRISWKSTGAFYRKRFARVWPLHFALLLVMAIFFATPQRQSVGRMIANLFLVQSWIPNLTWSQSYCGVAWTLSVEAFFYLVFPLLVIGGPKKFLNKFAFIAIGVLTLLAFCQSAARAGAFAGFASTSAFAMTNPFVRLLEFSAGIGVGFFFLARTAKQPTISRRWSAFLEITAVTAVVAYLPLFHALKIHHSVVQFPWLGNVFAQWFVASGPAPIFCFAIYAFSRSTGWVSQFLGSRLLVYLGEVSFAFYMVHSPVLRWVRGTMFEGSNISIVARVICGFTISLCISILTYHLLEIPARASLVARQFKAALTIAKDNLLSFVGSRQFVPTSLVLFGAIFYLNRDHVDQPLPGQIEQIVQSTPTELRDVHWEGDASLLGITTNQLQDRSLEIQMVWRLQDGHRPIRFLHICDENEKIVALGPSNKQLFAMVEPNHLFVDRVIVPAHKLKGANHLGIGFFDPHRAPACSTANKGPRAMANRRLKIYELPSMVAAEDSVKR